MWWLMLEVLTVFAVDSSTGSTWQKAMIDERVNFNQNCAASIFGEVNRLISQAFLPSFHPPSHSLLHFPLHTTTSDAGTHICLFPINTLPCSFPPSPKALIPPHPQPVTWTSTHPLRCSLYNEAYHTVTWTETSKSSISLFNSLYQQTP